MHPTILHFLDFDLTKAIAVSKPLGSIGSQKNKFGNPSELHYLC